MKLLTDDDFGLNGPCASGERASLRQMQPNNCRYTHTFSVPHACKGDLAVLQPVFFNYSRVSR